MQRYNAKAWCFTINNFNDSDIDNIKRLSEDPTCLKLICGKEIGLEGTPHLQGYISFTTSKRINAVNTLFLNKAHIESARKEALNSLIYCSKDGDIVICKGFDIQEMRRLEAVRKNKTKRIDSNEKAGRILSEIVNLTKTEFIISNPSFYVNRNRIFNELYSKKMIQLNTYDGELSDKNIWIAGTAGTGKSRFANSLEKPQYIYRKLPTQFWDGYDETHSIVLLEEMSPRHFENPTFASLFKQWCDRYIFAGNIKCKPQISIAADNFCFIVTSNYTIEECLACYGKEQEAVARRFKEYILITQEDSDTLSEPPYLQVIKDKRQKVYGDELTAMIHFSNLYKKDEVTIDDPPKNIEELYEFERRNISITLSKRRKERMRKFYKDIKTPKGVNERLRNIFQKYRAQQEEESLSYSDENEDSIEE